MVHNFTEENKKVNIYTEEKVIDISKSQHFCVTIYFVLLNNKNDLLW